MECYTPATVVPHASRTAESAEITISIEAVLVALRAFDAEKCCISCTNIYFIPVSYSLTSELRSSGPAEAAHVGGGAPFTPWCHSAGSISGFPTVPGTAGTVILGEYFA